MSNLILFLKNFIIYLGIYKINYKFSTKIDFGSKKANNFFKRKIKISKQYLEYGSGNSTLYVHTKKKNYISVESKKDIYKNLNNKRLNVYFYDLGISRRFSIPYFIDKKKNKILNYVKAIENFNVKPDLILIDGRFRVLCFFFIMHYLKIKKLKKTKILFDDFDRSEYSIAKKYFKFNMTGRLGETTLLKQIKKFNLKKIEDKYLKDPS